MAIVGCGPLGLSAVQGARIAGASTIIAIDPIQVRREMARKVGATHADPHAEGRSLSGFARLPLGPPIALVGRTLNRTTSGRWRGLRHRGRRRRQCTVKVGAVAGSDGRDGRPAGVSDVRARRPFDDNQPRAWKYLDTRHAVHDWRRDAPSRTGRRRQPDARRPGSSACSSRDNTTRSRSQHGSRHSSGCSRHEEVAYRTTITAIMTT